MTSVSAATAVKKVQKIEKELTSFIFERDEHIHLISIAVCGGFNLVLLGAPGTAKSYMVIEWTKRITGAKYFEQLLHKFGAPEELFGPYSLKALENDEFFRVTRGKLPEAHIVFLDEVFKSNPSNLNTLLPPMNEKVFHNAGQKVQTPIISIIGASNELPDKEDGLDALYDRFHLRAKVNHIRDLSNFKKMLYAETPTQKTCKISLQELELIQKASRAVEFDEKMADILGTINLQIKKAGIGVTDRRWKFAYRILKAEAFFKGKEAVEEQDFEILESVLWNDPTEIRKVQKIILENTNPDFEEILSLFEAIRNTGEKALGIEDAGNRINQGIEACQEMRKAREKMSKLINKMKKHGKDVKKVRTMLKQATDLSNKVLEDCVGCAAEDLV